MITKNDLNWWFDREAELDWQFATTYAVGAPHEYVIADKTPGFTQEDAARAAHVIRTYGKTMKFYRDTRVYLVTPMGWKHWDTQGAVLEDNRVDMINRDCVEHVYGIQNMPRTTSGVESTYDGLATTWDLKYGMTEEEKQATASLIRQTFGEKLRRTLDVGCGTGLPLDLELVEPVRYVGIDPSTAMLNALVMKHPVLAGLHPMSYAEAEQHRVLSGTIYDTVLVLGGSASYLSPTEIEQLQARAKRDVLLMHYTPDAFPIALGFDSELARESLQTATAFGSSQTQFGRFTVSILSGTGVAESS
ncbi:MAG: class I SAM-dependent methyltransferase [Microbacteriaceae bacterium]